ncbi:MAG: hypothetical protein OEV23_01600 [Gallionella sp.]|nr:hypothetical protein [Gallionella sp.]
MIRLDQALRAWGTPGFQDALKRQIAQCADQLPLQNGLSFGSHVTDAPVTVLINSATELEDVIRVHAGIFYRSVLAGCSCADDPTPVSENNEYCEVRLDIDKASAVTAVALLTE